MESRAQNVNLRPGWPAYVLHGFAAVGFASGWDHQSSFSFFFSVRSRPFRPGPDSFSRSPADFSGVVGPSVPSFFRPAKVDTENEISRNQKLLSSSLDARWHSLYANLGSQRQRDAVALRPTSLRPWWAKEPAVARCGAMLAAMCLFF